jgi:hypothetical protein
MVSTPVAQVRPVDQLSPAESEVLDAILSLWHRWQQADKGVNGFNRKTPVIGDTRPFRTQHHSQLEQLDADLDNFQCRQVNHEVRQMEDPHRTAIYMDARNLCLGIAVWSSPRLPDSAEARAVILKYARMFLVKRLKSSGVM